ncbi:hypothetical protein VTO73DRAFT_12145 [Trametes versicolor]
MMLTPATPSPPARAASRCCGAADTSPPSEYTTTAYEGHRPTMMHTTQTPVMLLSPINAVVSTCTRHGLDARLWLAATLSCIEVVCRYTNTVNKAPTRIEDASDCLLSPFDIFMALVYDGGLMTSL